MNRYLGLLLGAALVLAGPLACSTQDNGACAPKTCADLGRSCGEVDDGCGKTLTCGSCQQGQSCTAEGACVQCTSETDAQFCARLTHECGSTTAPDNCGASRTVDCGSCTAPQVCSAEGHCGDCVPETDEAFCTRNHAECGTMTAPDNCGASRTPASCGDCSVLHPGWLCVHNVCSNCHPDCTGKQCGDDGCGGSCIPGCRTGETCDAQGQCISSGTPNDTCTSPKVLKLTSGEASATGDLAQAHNDYSASCGGSDGNDEVYTFTLADARHVEIAVLPNSSKLVPVIALRSDCANNKPSAEIGCSDGTAGQNTYLMLLNLAPGQYWILIDAATSAGGAYDIIVTADPV